MRVLLAACLISYCPYLIAQVDLPREVDLLKLGMQYDRLAATIQQQSKHLLTMLERQDASVLNVLSKKDSAAAVMLRANYEVSLMGRMSLPDYLPGLDSIQTALIFLQKQGEVGFACEKLTGLQLQLQRANAINAYARDRTSVLQFALSKYDLQGKLDGYRKAAYYYKQRFRQFKAGLHDPDKLSSSVLSKVRNQVAFQSFFRQHSYLSTLFRLPASDATDQGVAKVLPGLQTRAQVSEAVQERLGKGADLNRLLQGKAVDQTEASSATEAGVFQFEGLKEKAMASGGGSDTEIPAGKVNPYHGKSLWQRIQLGFDMQTQSSSTMLPALSDLGISIGYRINRKSLVGVGVAYKLGWGQPFEHIHLSGQGAALRSFLDWKLKGSIWLTGSYEVNYFSAFGQISQLYRLSSCQSSALFGLMKTYQTGRRTGSIKLLCDALYRQHIPQSQPLVFRAGYSLH